MIAKWIVATLYQFFPNILIVGIEFRPGTLVEQVTVHLKIKNGSFAINIMICFAELPAHISRLFHDVFDFKCFGIVNQYVVIRHFAHARVGIEFF